MAGQRPKNIVLNASGSTVSIAPALWLASPAPFFSPAGVAPIHTTISSLLVRFAADRGTSISRTEARGSMDKSSIIGSIIGLACMLGVGWLASHGHWAMFWSEKGMIAVFGGTISVIFIAMPLEKIKCVPGYMKRFLFNKGRSAVEVVQSLSQLGEKARRDGILALEPEIERLQETDPFLASGLRMAVDGVDPEGIEATLRMEILAMQERHKAGKKFFDLIKLYAPGWGLVATLIGQIGMFGNLGGDISILGHMLAVAVVATMYGTVLANAVAGPIGDKLALRSSEEILGREMMLQGILSIQAGDNPRVTLDRMMAFLPMDGRAKLQAAA